MATRKQRLHPFHLTVALLLSASLPACTPSAPVAGPSQVTLVTLDELPPAARFVEIGNIGQAYRLQTTLPANVRFPASQQHTSALLPGTVRLFHFDEQHATWTEVADSRFDGQTSELVGNNLVPGLYTAFGWSANPVENALQRLLLDAQRGFRVAPTPYVSVDQLRFGILSLPERERLDRAPGLVRDFVQVSATLEQTSCRLADDLDECSAECRRHTQTPVNQRQGWSFCPNECPEPQCCECEDFTVTERAWVPENLLRPTLQPCPGWPNGRPCPLCGEGLNGLSCLTSQSPNIELIRPNLTVLDYSVMHRVGLSPLVEDRILRTAWHSAIEEMLGGRFQDPSPQPSR